jgi:HK97 gp10 family phage protein
MAVRETDIGRLRARLFQIPRDMPLLHTAGAKLIAGWIRDEAKQRVPVDTGSLQKSIRIEITRRGGKEVVGVAAGGYITNPKTGRKVDYAGFVEYGTSRQWPQPYLRPAIGMYARMLPREIVKQMARRRI